MLVILSYLFAATHFFVSLLSIALAAAPVLPQPLVIIVPLITTLITSWLSHSALPSWANSLIAFVVIIVVAALWALFSGQLAGDLVADFVLIAAYAAALQAGPLAGLQQWLMLRLPSPLDVVLGPSHAMEITIHSVHYPLTKQSAGPDAISLGTLPPPSSEEA